MKHIYLDYNATTPIHPEVAEAMIPFLRDHFGNPSSSHWFGVQTRKAVETARSQVAALLQCNPDEIIFTSGGSESDNFAIAGYAFKHRRRGNHIITAQIEHPAVLEICRYLETQGFQITYLPVDSSGKVSVADVEANLRPSTLLISIMQANNEVGTIQPIREISDLAHKHGAVMHTDAAQAIGKIPVTVPLLGVDMLTIAGHKLYAPKGIGALYVKRGIELQKMIYGAGHEQGLRAGTENVLEIVGLGKACEIAARELERQAPRMKKLRDELQSELTSRLTQAQINGDQDSRLPNTLSVSFPGLEANAIISELDLVACSPGAACHSDKVMMSHVLEAMKVPVEFAMGTIRFSVGYMTTDAEIREAADAIESTINRLSPNAGASAASIATDDEIRLTKYTHGLGCACKLRPQALEKILKDLPKPTDANVLIGTDSSDDAAVYKLTDDLAVVQTVDFFTPIVDDPYHFGAIAATNSLSDIYAMGAKPVFALSVVGFPSNRLPMSVLQQILQGAADKAKEAGIDIIGGHTIDDTEPKFGLAVSGIVHPAKIKANKTARIGDKLILTKPIGTGIISTAIKRQIVGQGAIDTVVRVMSTLNKRAAEIMSRYDVSACTDVTGFGLLGHLREMTIGSGVDALVESNQVPILDDVVNLAAAGVIPGGTENNLDFVSNSIDWADGIPRVMKYVLADAQTSGGLLIAVKADQAEKMLTELKSEGVAESAIVGQIVAKGSGRIKVV